MFNSHKAGSYFSSLGISAPATEDTLEEQRALAMALRDAWKSGRREECYRLLLRVSNAHAPELVEVLVGMVRDAPDSLASPARLDKPQEIALLLLAERREPRILSILIHQLFVKKPYLHAHILPLIRNYGYLASAYLIGIFSHSHDARHLNALLSIIELLGETKDPFANTTLLGLLSSNPIQYDNLAIYGILGIFVSAVVTFQLSSLPLLGIIVGLGVVGVSIGVSTHKSKIVEAALSALEEIADPTALHPLISYAHGFISSSNSVAVSPGIASAIKATLMNTTPSHRGWLDYECLRQLQNLMENSQDTSFLVRCVLALEHLGDREMYRFLERGVHRSWMFLRLAPEVEEAIQAVLPSMEARLLREEDAFTLLRPSSAVEDGRMLLRPATDRGSEEPEEQLLRPAQSTPNNDNHRGF